MLQDGENSSHGAPEVVCIQCKGNVDSVRGTRPANIPIAKGWGLPENGNIRRRFLDNAMDSGGGSRGGGGGEEERQEAKEWERGHPAFDGRLWKGYGGDGIRGEEERE